jgi:hypothetical protein
VGSKVQVLAFGGAWYDELPTHERERVKSMIGEVFEVDEIDEFGQTWVTKWWKNEADETALCHSVALAPHEMVCV